MPGGFQPDRDLLGETEPTADLVLGAPALLGIFFAAALLCAVCFGFGYSSGHTVHRTPLVESDETASASRTPAIAPRVDAPPASIIAPDASATAAAPDDSAGTEPGFPPAEAAPPATGKPAPGAGYAAPKATASAPAQTEDLPPSQPQNQLSTRSGAAQQQQYVVPRHAPAVAPGVNRTDQSPAVASSAAPAAAQAAAAPATPALNLMVQIAAVSHAADAETLASALRHDGFAAIVRTTTGDPLFHIQVGPFPTLQAAKAMRARLGSVGYNAFIKP